MILSEYFRKNPVSATVLFTDRVSKANAAIRQLNIASDIVSANIIASTVSDFAQETVTAYLSYNDPGSLSELRFISPRACEYILMNILHENSFDSFGLSSLSSATIRDILSCMNEIRANGLTDAGKTENNPKLRDLLSVIGLFEKMLDDRTLYDEVKTVKKATEYLESDNVRDWMFGIDDKKYALLAGDRFSRSENELTGLLASISGQELTEIEYISEFAGSNISTGYSVYKCYGIANEVRLVIDSIYDKNTHCAKVPYDAVSVYYSNPRYINFIKAEFDRFKIPYTIKSGNPAIELNITRFILACLECAQNDMLYAELEKVILNPLTTFRNISEDNVVSNPVRAYYNALSAGIGWGRERYRAYIDNAGNEADPFFVAFLKDFIDVFEEQNTCSKILSKLSGFTEKYTYKQNPDKRLIKAELNKQVNNLKYVKDSLFSMADRISLVREAIESMKVSDDADENSVSICSVDDACVIERQFDYFLGMSSNDFALDTKQSPVMLDMEKSRWINGAEDENSSVELAGRKNERRKTALKKALVSIENNKFDESAVVFTYMSFDTTTLRDSSPSVIIYEIMRETGCGEKKAPGYDGWESYITEDIRISTDDIRESIKERSAKIKEEREKKRAERLAKAGEETTEKPNEDDNEKPEIEESDEELKEKLGEEVEEELTEERKDEEGEKKRDISASGLQVMLACPLKYYYRYICQLKEVQHLVPESHMWLGATQKGTLCHRIMEGYLGEVMPPARAITDAPDQDVFEKIFNEELQNILNEQPYPSVPIKKREEDLYRELNVIYLQMLHKEWYEDHKKGKDWKVIGCEVGFGKGYLNPDGDILVYEGSYKGESYKMPINGSIDRLDGYMDGNTLKLRIVDYKTGKLANKKEEVELGVQIQHYMYAMGAIEYLKSDTGKDRLIKVFGLIPAEYEFESICYAFPYENDPKEVLETVEDVKKVLSGGRDIGEMKVDFPEDISRQIVNTICKWSSEDSYVAEEYIEQEIRAKVKTKYEYLYNEALKKARESDASAEKPKSPVLFGPAEFCEKNYCTYKDVCRKWVDVDAIESADKKGGWS